MTYDHKDLIQELPDDEDEIKRAQAVLIFIGEAWINGHAREVDESRCEFTVPLSDLHRDYTTHLVHWGDEKREWAIHSTATNYHVSDAMKRHENAPEWVNNWDGPFTIKMKTWGI